MSLIDQGLVLSLLGLLLTFSALGALILLIVVLQRLFGPAEESAIPTATLSGDEGDDLADVAAAIAAAVAFLRAHDQAASGLGETLQSGPGRWWAGPPPVSAPLTPTPRDGRTKP